MTYSKSAKILNGSNMTGQQNYIDPGNFPQLHVIMMENLQIYFTIGEQEFACKQLKNCFRTDITQVIG